MRLRPELEKMWFEEAEDDHGVKYLFVADRQIAQLEIDGHCKFDDVA